MGSILVLTAAGGGAPSAARAEGWVTVASGHEDDITANLELGLASVPGGPFLQFAAGGETRLGTSRALGLQAHASWQRFLTGERRGLAGAAAEADWRQPLGGRWALTPAATAFFLEDSSRPDARLLGGGADLALGRRTTAFEFEVRGGWEVRSYPRLELLGQDATREDHLENRWHVGPGLTWRPSAAWLVTTTATAARIDAREPWYEASEFALWGALRWRLGRWTRVVAHGLTKERVFSHRPAQMDDDRVRQLGAAVEQDLSSRLTAMLGWVFTYYADPLDVRHEVDRVSLALTWRLGGAAPVGPGSRGSAVPRAGRPVTFAHRAPDARRVALVGDFNGWNPEAHPMIRAGDGWWTIELALPAGSHQFAYDVDGAWVPPQSGFATVPDGFGGRNGMLVVKP